MPTLHDFEATTIDGQSVSLSRYAGNVVLVVNVASKCGLTPQYEGLQRLYEIYADEPLEILAFPCNQFGGQEPGSEDEIEEFCRTNFNITFPLFAKIEVNGGSRDPLYAWLSEQKVGPEEPGDIGWNFTKFVVDKKGVVVERHSPRTEPQDADVVATLNRQLKT